jgi:hypothetical protein
MKTISWSRPSGIGSLGWKKSWLASSRSEDASPSWMKSLFSKVSDSLQARQWIVELAADLVEIGRDPAICGLGALFGPAARRPSGRQTAAREKRRVAGRDVPPAPIDPERGVRWSRRDVRIEGFCAASFGSRM